MRAECLQQIPQMGIHVRLNRKEVSDAILSVVKGIADGYPVAQEG